MRQLLFEIQAENDGTRILITSSRTGGIVLGQLLWVDTGTGPEIKLLHVRPDYRRMGYAKAMLGLLEALKGKARPDYLTPMGAKWWRGIGRTP